MNYLLGVVHYSGGVGWGWIHWSGEDDPVIALDIFETGVTCIRW